MPDLLSSNAIFMSPIERKKVCVELRTAEKSTQKYKMDKIFGRDGAISSTVIPAATYIKLELTGMGSGIGCVLRNVNSRTKYCCSAVSAFCLRTFCEYYLKCTTFSSDLRISKVSFRPKYFVNADSNLPPSPTSRPKSAMRDEIYLSTGPYGYIVFIISGQLVHERNNPKVTANTLFCFYNVTGLLFVLYIRCQNGILIPLSVDAPNPHILYFPMLVRDGGGKRHHGTSPRSVDEIYLSTAPNMCIMYQISESGRFATGSFRYRSFRYNL